MKLKNWQIGITLLTSVFYFFYYFGRYNYSITIPYIQDELGLSHAMVGLIATMLTGGYAIGQFINGFLIDRYGPRIMMTLGAFLSTGTNFLMSLGGSFQHLLYSWGLNGYVQAFGYGSCCKLYATWFKRENRGKPLGFNEFLQSFATMIILPIGAFIIATMGWRQVYVIPVLPLSIIAIIFYLTVRNTPSERGFTVPWRTEIEKAERKSFIDNAKSAYKIALSDWRMLLTYASYGGSQFTRFAIYTWVPAYILKITGEVIKAGWVTAAFPFGGAIGSLLIGYLSDRFKKRYPLIVGGMAISAASLIIFALFPTAPTLFLSAMLFLCGTGIEAVEVSYFLLPIDILDDADQQATGVGCMNAWGKAFATIQGGLFGFIVDLSGFQSAFLITGGISILAALAVIPIKK